MHSESPGASYSMQWKKKQSDFVLKITCSEQTSPKNPLEVNGHVKESHIVLDSMFSFVFL